MNKRPKYVYVASSWRNPIQMAVVALLKHYGVPCYDFRNPSPDEHGFNWRKIDLNWRDWSPSQWREALKHPIAQKGYGSGRAALLRCDCVVLVLPAGRSSHMEAAWAAGQGKRILTFCLEKVEPELMQLLLGPPENLCVKVGELLTALGVNED